MSEILVGAINPIEAFNGQVHDLIQITDSFENGTSDMTALDYLRVAHTVQENLSALVTATVSSIMNNVMHSDKVTSDDMATHAAEVEALPDDENERIGRALNRISKHFTVDDDGDGNTEETPDVS